MPDRPTAAQIRGARGMLNWSMLDLAQAARVSVSTVKRCEGAGAAAVADATLGAVQEALEGRGIAFLADEGRGAGLRFDPGAPVSSLFAEMR